MENDVQTNMVDDTAVKSAPLSSNTWEHPWTIDEIRKNANKWSLAADVGLLEYMKDFASRLTAHAHDVSREVSQLLHDTQLTDAKIQSVTDYFLTLSDSQFIENRVYDEDEVVTKDEKKDEAASKTREQREVDMMPRLKEAVGFGLNVISDAYDVLDVEVADSDDSEDDEEGIPLPPDEVILEPKDPYVTRPLPYLIGSRGFHEEEFVGVGDLLSSDEAESEAGSLSESDEDIEKAPSVSDVSTSDYDTDVESDASETAVTPARKKAPTLTSSEDFSSSDDERLFAKEKKVEIDNASATSSEEEVTKKRSKSKRSSVEKEIPKTRSKSKRSQQGQDMFDQEEPEDDLFSASGGLFSKSGGLFDAPESGLFEGVEDFDDVDSDDEASSVTEQQKSPQPAEKEKSKPTQKKLPPGGVSLFGGAIKKGFFNHEKSGESDAVEQAEEQPKKSMEDKSDLFDEESDDDDLFRRTPPKPASAAKEKPLIASKPVQVKSKGLFDEESDQDDLFTNEKEVKSKRPVGGVSVFGSGGNLLEEAIKKRASSSATDTVSHNPAPTPQVTDSKSPISIQSDTGAKSHRVSNVPSLSSSSNNDQELFGAQVSKGKPTINKTKQLHQKLAKGGLFGSSSEDEDMFSNSGKSSKAKSDVKGSTQSISSSTSLASKKPQMGKDDALLAASQKKIKTTKSVSKSVRDQTKSAETVKSDSKSNLFRNSDSDGELFGVTKTVKPTSTSKGVAQLPSSDRDDDDDDDDGDDGLFSRKPPPVKTGAGFSSLSTASKPSQNKLKSTSNVFGSSDEEDDLITPPKGSKNSLAPSSATAAKLVKSKPSNKISLFNESESDDDDLFSGMSKSTPRTVNTKTKATTKDEDENLFGGKSSIASKPKSSGKSKPATTKQSNDLFGSGSDDDLFTSKPTKTATAEVPLLSEPTEVVLAVEEEKEEEVAPKKKLPGAVSMFGAGGDDLLKAISKRRSASQKSNVSNISANSEKESVPPQALENQTETKDKEPPAVSSKEPVTNVTPKPFSLSTASVKPSVTKIKAPMPKASGNVSKLQSNLTINPSALLPGAAPKIVSTVDVDAPLESATKTRARGQAGRRPPSRTQRRRVAEAAEKSIFSTPEASSSIPSEPTTSSSLPTSNEKVVSEETKKASNTVATLNQETDDLFSTDIPVKNSINDSKSTATKKKTSKLPDLFDDIDIILEPSKGTSTSKTNIKEDDDIFSSKPSTSVKSSSNVDIFADVPSVEPHSSLFSTSKDTPKSKKHTLFDDDLFADLDDIKSTSTKSSEPSSVVENGGLSDVPSSLSSKTTEKKSNKTPEVKTFDEDDLFGTPITKKKAKPAPKVDDIFGDDLFNDIPASKPKEKKSSKNSSAKNVATTSIFDDDDIFSSTKPAKKSQKETKAKKKTKKRTEKPSSIPKDGGDVFEDPLNALLGP